MPNKPPILFLHGAFAGPEVWTRFVAPWFADRGHRVFAPALPGRGGARARLRDYVATARDACDAIGAPPIVIGHSLGGFVAQHLAAERRIAGLALICSPGPAGLGPSLWRLGSSSPDVLASLALAQAGAGAMLGVKAARRALFTEETPDEWIMEVAPPPAPESAVALLDGMSWDLPVWPLVRRAPVLGLMGDKDAFIPTSDLAAIALTYGAETEILHGFAHGAPIDHRWRSLAWRIDAWMNEKRVGQIRPPGFGWLGWG